MVFLFKLETNPSKMTMVKDLLVNWNMMFSLKLRKKNQTEMKMVDDFLARGQGIY